MRKYLIGFVGISLSWALTINAQQRHNFEFRPGQSIYIVVLRTADPFDPKTIEILNRARTRGRRDDRRHPKQDRPTLDRPVPERKTLERPTTAPDRSPLKDRIEEEFRKYGKFKLVSSPESADFVFLAIGRFDTLLVMQQRANATIIVRGPKSEAASSDELLLSVVGLAIPSSAYRETMKYPVEFSNVAQWQGVVVGVREAIRENDLMQRGSIASSHVPDASTPNGSEKRDSPTPNPLARKEGKISNPEGSVQERKFLWRAPEVKELVKQFHKEAFEKQQHL